MAKDQIYPFAVARVRMLERSLLTEKQYVQMAEAKNIEEALKVLSEVGYGEGIYLAAKNYEEALSAQLSKAYSDVAELVNKENFMDVFLLKNDYHNLKVLMKSEISMVDGSKFLVQGGTVDTQVLKNAFETKAMDTLPSSFNEAISKAYDAYGKSMSGQMIDVVLDRAAFKHMNETALNSGSDFVKKYMEYLCDITNLKSFVRVKNMKKSFEFFLDVFVEGGSLGMDSFRQAFGAENAAAGFRTTPYAQLCEYTLEGVTAFEKKCDNFMMSFIKGAKYKSLTLEPMVAYVYARETEVKTVRIILSSKVNNIDASVIKERLRDAYV